MRAPYVVAMAMGMFLTGCGAPGRAPPHYFVIPPGPTAAGGSPAPADAPLRTLPPTPNPEVQQFLPGPSPEELGRAPAPVQEPGRSATPFYTPPYSGPVTGYGPGGMAQPPGAPPNPPDPPGGLMRVP